MTHHKSTLVLVRVRRRIQPKEQLGSGPPCGCNWGTRQVELKQSGISRGEGVVKCGGTMGKGGSVRLSYC